MKTKILNLLLNIKKVLLHGATISVFVGALFLWGLVEFLYSNRPIAKVYACQNFSAECELEKDQIAILPIEFDKKILDPYGNLIDTSINQWYLVNKMAKILIPTNFYMCLKSGRDGCVEATDHPSPEEIVAHYTNILKVDTVDVSAFIPGVKKAVIIVSGPNEVQFTGANSIIVAYTKEKVTKN